MGYYIPLEGTFNFRDIGGERTGDGRQVKRGCLFRSDALHKLTGRDQVQLSAMGIRTVVDFRAPEEAAPQPNRLPDGIRTVVLTPHADLAAQASASHSDDETKIRKMEEHAETEAGRSYFQKNLDAMEGQMRQFVTGESGIRCYSAFLKLLAEPEATPLIFHCRGGKDRTGWGAALILSVLGVSRDDVVKDYMKTADYNQERNRKRMDEYRQYTDNPLLLDYLASLMQVKELYMWAAFEEVDLAGGMERYVREVLGIAEGDLNILKEKFLD